MKIPKIHFLLFLFSLTITEQSSQVCLYRVNAFLHATVLLRINFIFCFKFSKISGTGNYITNVLSNYD